MKLGQAAASDADWQRFSRRYRAEMTDGAASHDLNVLAALSRHANFSVGCYCEHEARCHRSILRHLLEQRGAVVDQACSHDG
jgi:uncharacterized protein YeaO (DUF488 family)